VDVWLTDKCRIDVTHRFTCNEFRDGLGIDDVITLVWQNMFDDVRWYEHVLRKDEND